MGYTVNNVPKIVFFTRSPARVPARTPMHRGSLAVLLPPARQTPPHRLSTVSDERMILFSERRRGERSFALRPNPPIRLAGCGDPCAGLNGVQPGPNAVRPYTTRPCDTYDHGEDGGTCDSTPA